jgi:hypothetical protein
MKPGRKGSVRGRSSIEKLSLRLRRKPELSAQAPVTRRKSFAEEEAEKWVSPFAVS